MPSDGCRGRQPERSQPQQFRLRWHLSCCQSSTHDMCQGATRSLYTCMVGRATVRDKSNLGPPHKGISLVGGHSHKAFWLLTTSVQGPLTTASRTTYSRCFNLSSKLQEGYFDPVPISRPCLGQQGGHGQERGFKMSFSILKFSSCSNSVDPNFSKQVTTMAKSKDKLQAYTVCPGTATANNLGSGNDLHQNMPHQQTSPHRKLLRFLSKAQGKNLPPTPGSSLS